jgi:hypothetical protein
MPRQPDPHRRIKVNVAAVIANRSRRQDRRPGEFECKEWERGMLGIRAKAWNGTRYDTGIGAILSPRADEIARDPISLVSRSRRCGSGGLLLRRRGAMPDDISSRGRSANLGDDQSGFPNQMTARISRQDPALGVEDAVSHFAHRADDFEVLVARDNVRIDNMLIRID